MSQHVIPQKVYYLVFVTLILLTLVTVDVAFYNFGFLNIYIAMGIATVKATIVALYFMHLRYNSRLTWLFAGAGILWLFIMFVLTIADYITR
ncbi:MAG: cytochrome C oxidase subunit IV family protein [Bacteroidetes bacterium]|nr:cytochrome C oxidase subunit IV family protein [Bacteroidota bacterium]MCW5897339.1 cytochrome C oxidase subunit IV family protein [Bacteroidota bacterium]